jgi:hypothetical protein
MKKFIVMSMLALCFIICSAFANTCPSPSTINYNVKNKEWIIPQGWDFVVTAKYPGPKSPLSIEFILASYNLLTKESSAYPNKIECDYAYVNEYGVLTTVKLFSQEIYPLPEEKKESTEYNYWIRISSPLFKDFAVCRVQNNDVNSCPFFKASENINP